MSGLMQTNLWIERRRREADAEANLRIRNYDREYAILTTSQATESGILLSPGLPRLWSQHPANQVAVCIRLNPIQDQTNPLIWYCRAEYTTDWKLEDYDDPVSSLPLVDWDFEDRQVPAYHVLQKIKKKTTFAGAGGQPERTVITTMNFTGMMQNSARQPFDNPVMVDKCDPVLVIEFVSDFFDAPTALLFTNSLNKDQFLGADPGQVRCKIRAKRFQWRSVYRWTVNYRFAYRAEGWQPTVLDQGALYLDPDDDTNQIPFTDRDGNPIIKLLDGFGHPLETGKDSIFLDAPVYPIVAFAPLRVPQIMARIPTLNQ